MLFLFPPELLPLLFLEKRQRAHRGTYAVLISGLASAHKPNTGRVCGEAQRVCAAAHERGLKSRVLPSMPPKPQFSNVELPNSQVTSDEMTYVVSLLDPSIGMLLIQTRSVSFPELFINPVA